jgi:hypothetical protein
MKRTLPAALALVLAACAPTAPPPGAAQEEVAELWTADTRTVLTGDAAMALARQCSRVSPGPVESQWTPTDSEVDALENELILLVAREMEEAGQDPAPGGYYRQYAGFVINGRRVIYVNGVDESAVQRAPDPAHQFDWRTQPITICDGGPITFGVEYDTGAQRFSNFAFNGSIG